MNLIEAIKRWSKSEKINQWSLLILSEVVKMRTPSPPSTYIQCAFQGVFVFCPSSSPSSAKRTVEGCKETTGDRGADLSQSGCVSNLEHSYPLKPPFVLYTSKVEPYTGQHEYLARSTGPTNQSQGGGLSSGANATQSDSSGEVGQDFGRAVSDRLCK